MNHFIPWVFQTDIEHSFGFSRSAFYFLKENNISKAFICLNLSSDIIYSHSGFLCETISNIKDIVSLCQKFSITPILTFYLSIFIRDGAPKIVVPKTYEAIYDLLSVLVKSKRNFVTIYDFHDLFLNNRKNYLIGENMADYTYCPYSYRPFPFMEKLYAGNVTSCALYDQERFNEEHSIKGYDFFFSTFSPLDYKLRFYTKCKEKQLPFVDCATVFESALEDEPIMHNFTEVKNELLINGEAYVNYSLHNSPQKLLSNIEICKSDLILKMLEQNFI